nr:uncharacterized protein LOC109429926 [Aedes albopictus]
MTPTRGKKRLAALNYGQRRRRLRHLASYASSVDSPKTLLSVQQPTIVRPPPLQQWRRDPGHDSNNNVPTINPSGKSYLVGAIVYKTLEDDLRLHVFDQYVVKVRREELTGSTIETIASEFASATTGKSTCVTSVYLAQRQVPVNCSGERQLELERKAYWRVNSNYRTNVNFQRRYIEAVRYEYGPRVGGSYSYKSTACLNV